MSLLIGVGDFGIGGLVAEANDAASASVVASAAAVGAATSVQEGKDLGPYNAATNTPSLNADASGVVVGGYYNVTVEGAVNFAGQNFSAGQVFAVGDRIARIGSQWYRRPFVISSGAEIASSASTAKAIMNRTATQQQIEANQTAATISTNLFNKAAVVEGKEVRSDGTILARSDDAVTPYIPVNAGSTYTISGLVSPTNSSRLYAWLASDKATVVGLVTFLGTNGSTITAPSGAAYLVFSLKGRTSTITAYDSVQVEVGSTATAYVAYKAALSQFNGLAIQASVLAAGATAAPPTQDNQVATLATVKAYGATLTFDRGTNLFNKAAVVEGLEVRSTGATAARSDDAVSEYIAVTAGVTYTISGLISPTNSSRLYAWLAADKTTVVGSVTFLGTNGSTITAPAGAAYLIFSLKGRTSTITTYDTVQVQTGSVATAYKPYQPPAVTAINGTALSSALPATATLTGNLFDKSKAVVGREVRSDGTTLARSDDAVTDYIAILPGTTYTISGLYTPISTSRTYAFLASDKTTLIGSTGLLGTTGSTLTAPSGSAYLIFSLKGRTAAAAFDLVQVEVGSRATAFKPYSVQVLPAETAVQSLYGAKIYSQPTDPAHAISLYHLQTMSGTKGTLNKKMLLFGDSITETTPEAGGTRDNWPAYVGNLGLASISNYARAGSAYKDVASNAWQRITTQIDRAITANETPDIIVFSCGTNDGISSLGTYAGAMAKAALSDLDRTNLYEALRYCYWKASTQWPTALICAVTPLQRSDAEPDTLTGLFAAIRSMANRYNVRVIDAQNESGVIKDFEVNGAAGRYLYDGLHPNAAGRALMAKLISAKLLSYLAQ